MSLIKVVKLQIMKKLLNKKDAQENVEAYFKVNK